LLLTYTPWHAAFVLALPMTQMTEWCDRLVARMPPDLSRLSVEARAVNAAQKMLYMSEARPCDSGVRMRPRPVSSRSVPAEVGEAIKLGRCKATLAVGGLILAAQLAGPLSPASARTPVDAGGVGSGATNTCPDRVGRGTAWVTLYGDWIAIRDNCSDGIRVKGVVTMTVNGQLKTYTCVNYGGGGTTHECSFDWIEGCVGVKTLAFYSERTAGKGDWVLGQIAHWRDG